MFVQNNESIMVEPSHNNETDASLAVVENQQPLSTPYTTNDKASNSKNTKEHEWGWIKFFIGFSIALYLIDLGSDLGSGMYYLYHGIHHSKENSASHGFLIWTFAVISFLITAYADHGWTPKIPLNEGRNYVCCNIKEFFRHGFAPLVKSISAYKVARDGKMEKEKRLQLKSGENSRSEQTLTEIKESLERENLIYCKKLEKENDVALLRMFEGYFEAAPQLILQMHILLQNYVTDGSVNFLPVASQFFSFLSIACAMTAFVRSTRLREEDNPIKLYVIGFCIFPWHLCMIVSRILPMVLLLQVSMLHFFICFGSMWLVFFAYFNFHSPEFTQDKSRRVNIFYNIVLSGVFLFSFIVLKEGNTRMKYIAFYAYLFTTNIIMLSLAYFLSPSIIHPGYLMLGIVSIPSFFIGLFSMLTYYTCFHPNILNGEGSARA